VILRGFEDGTVFSARVHADAANDTDIYNGLRSHDSCSGELFLIIIKLSIKDYMYILFSFKDALSVSLDQICIQWVGLFSDQIVFSQIFLYS